MEKVMITPQLENVQKTLLLPLWGRAQAGRMNDPVLIDHRAEELISRMNYDFSPLFRRLGLFHALMLATRAREFARENIERIPKLLPIFSISGDMDPFGNFGEGVKNLFALYSQHGIKNASFILYRDGRHEMLRETNRQDVFKDIIHWLNSPKV